MTSGLRTELEPERHLLLVVRVEIPQRVHPFGTRHLDVIDDAGDAAHAEHALGRGSAEERRAFAGELGTDLLGHLMEVGREQEELVGLDPEALLVDPAFPKHDRLATAEQPCADERPFLERGQRARHRHRCGHPTGVRRR